MVEPHVGIHGRDRLAGPGDAGSDRVNAVVAAFGQKLGERQGQSADTAADVEHAVTWLEVGITHDSLEELGTDSAVVAVADEQQLVWRHRHEAIAAEIGAERGDVGHGVPPLLPMSAEMSVSQRRWCRRRLYRQARVLA